MANNQNCHHDRVRFDSFTSAVVIIMATMDDFKSRYSGRC